MRTPYGASLLVRVTSRTYDFHQTSPRGTTTVMTVAANLVLQADALVSSVSGSRRQGPGSDSHLLSVARASRTPLDSNVFSSLVAPPFFDRAKTDELSCCPHKKSTCAPTDVGVQAP